MITFHINDMTCGHCVSSVTQAVNSVDAQAGVRIDLAQHRVEIDTAADPDTMAAAIQEAGFTPVPA